MIINPWIFYWIGIAGNIGMCLFIIGLLAVIGGIISITCCDKSHTIDIIIVIIGCILFILSSLIPSEKTCYQMLAASLVTKDNIEYVTETGKDLIDYIIESAETLLRNEKIQYAEEH